jgi:ABC-2 type transport system permease protein
MQIFMLFFLWDAVFSDSSRQIFGYDRTKILTYVFGILIVRAFVMSSRSIDVAGEISQGDLANYLLKPVSYFKYWFVRDLSSKSLNLIFVFLETSIIFFVLKPPFFIQNDPLFFSLFLISLILAVILFFLILFIINFTPFWYPELAWGAQFLFIVIISEFLSGSVFPLDILPQSMQNILYFSPFPYLLFFPVQIYLGKFSSSFALRGIVISTGWIIILYFLMNFIWRRGLAAFRAEGR